MPENFETEKKNEDDRYNGKIGIEIKIRRKINFEIPDNKMVHLTCKFNENPSKTFS